MSELFDNRELSWLKFNERVLEEAEDKNVPLCERLSFLSIFESNLDEFFMVRIGSLVDQQLLKDGSRENKTNMTAEEQIKAVCKRLKGLLDRKYNAYEYLMNKIEEEGVKLINFAKLDKKESDYLEAYFNNEILPLLSPITVTKKQPFPFLKNKEIYAVAVLGPKSSKNSKAQSKSQTKTSTKTVTKERLGIIPCNNGLFQRLIEIPGTNGYYMLAEELILHYLPKVFSGYSVISKSLVRVTRNADIDADKVYDEELNYRDHMVEIIKKRRKLEPVRLEYTRELDKKILERLSEYIHVDKEKIFKSKCPLDLSFVFGIQDILRHKENLFYAKRVPQKSPSFDETKPLIPQVVESDKLLHYPYESIRPFLNMLHEAANDPNVVSIKMTLYRLAKHSKVVEALVEAAENGKQVDVLVELKARFDEENNIEWSRTLEKAGCHVIYGLDGLKVHSKLCLITLREDSDIKYITQIGTGNYNEKTSRLYTDLSLITADERIGAEASKVFAALSLGEVVEETEHLLVAPKCLQNKVIDKIQREIDIAKAGGDAYIGIKINSFTDKKIMDKIVEASQAGVKIEMVIRGICCLKSKVPGYTDNIRIVSIVGRFLEHSRIYIFGKGDREEIYIASADYMTRNTVRRVEVATPIYNEDLKRRLRYIFNVMLSDNVKAREQLEDGTYVKIADVIESIMQRDEEKKNAKSGKAADDSEDGVGLISSLERVNAQEKFYAMAYENAGVIAP